MNDYLGRRATIAITCIISFASCLGQAYTNNWYQLFLVRLVLGLGIGPKSATIPVYAVETVPKDYRGALVTQWQTWTAFGIMLGFLFGVAFQNSGVRAFC